MNEEILYRDHAMQLIGAGDVFVERWSAKGGRTQFRRLVEIHGAFVQRLAPAKSLHVVHWASGDLALLDAEMRGLIDEHVRVTEDHVAAAVLVIPEQGFGAAIFRLALSTALRLRRQRYPYRVMSELTEALDWLPGQRPEPTETLADAAALRTWYAGIEAELATSG